MIEVFFSGIQIREVENNTSIDSLIQSYDGSSYRHDLHLFNIIIVSSHTNGRLN